MPSKLFVGINRKKNVCTVPALSRSRVMGGGVLLLLEAG